MCIRDRKKVGASGTFLSAKQTRNYWKSEDYMPKIFDKTSYKEWVESGRKTVTDKAKQRYEEIISTHKPLPLTEKQDSEIEKILKEAEKFYKQKGLI